MRVRREIRSPEAWSQSECCKENEGSGSGLGRPQTSRFHGHDKSGACQDQNGKWSQPCDVARKFEMLEISTAVDRDAGEIQLKPGHLAAAARMQIEIIVQVPMRVLNGGTPAVR